MHTRWIRAVCGIMTGPMLLLSVTSALAKPCPPLEAGALRAMSTEHLSSLFCRYQQQVENHTIALRKYSGLRLKKDPSPVYQKSYEEAEAGRHQCVEQIRRLSLVLIHREEALPSCLSQP